MGVVTATILSEGAVIDPGYSLLSLEVSRELNRIPTAHLLLADGNVATGEFPISDSITFEPGKEVEIKLRYEGESDVTVFKGLVLTQGIRANEKGSVLSLDLKDKTVKLTQTRRNFVYRELSDGEIIGQLVEDAGLTKGNMETTQPTHPEIVQYNCTDWDFILSRADIYGLVVAVNDGAISLNKIDLSAEAIHNFEYGISELYDFEFELDASHQYSTVESVAWDLEGQQLTDPSVAEEFALSQGNLQGASLAEAVGFDNYRLSHPVPLAAEELQGWANGRLMRSRMAMIRGRLSLAGDAAIKPLDIMEVAGTSARFNGKTMVTGVRQLFDNNGWQTDVQFGLSEEWFSRKPEIEDVPSAGLLPAISGLQVGVVDAFEADPDEQLRVRITLPAIDTDDGIIWARLATPSAGAERGFFFRPEPGDEVVVGFFNNDPRRAVILGAMYSTTNAAPTDFADLTEDNINKGIVTKKGTKISFVDDEKASVSIETSNSNKIMLSDDSESIEITDQNGNSVVMNGDGIVSTDTNGNSTTMDSNGIVHADLNGNTITMDSNGIELADANGNKITMSSSAIEVVSGSDCKIEGSGNVEITGSAVDVM